SRRQALVAGATVSLALAVPAFAMKKSSSNQSKGTHAMTHSFVTTKDGVDIFYKDWGPKDAQPIMFHHGWPLSSDDWDAQMLFFLSKG
ncbi:MAG: alpha/beta hydrolase, partial [Mesorhizobium sp.]